MHSGEKSHVENALENFLQLENIYVTINLIYELFSINIISCHCHVIKLFIFLIFASIFNF